MVITVKGQNFSEKVPIEVGGKKVGVPLFPGATEPYEFISCNLTNREPPPGSTAKKSCTAICEYYYHGKTDTITVDGFAIEAKYYYQVIYGRWIGGPENSGNVQLDPANRTVDGVYEYYNTPESVEMEAPDS